MGGYISGKVESSQLRTISTMDETYRTKLNRFKLVTYLQLMKYTAQRRIIQI